MTPYYEDDGVILYHGDCRDVLPHLDSADLLVTDPPYGANFRSNRREERFDLIAEDDDPSGMASLVAEIIRSYLKRCRHAYVFGPLDLSPLVAEGVVQSPVELIWDKAVLGMGNLTLPWASQHETIQFMVAVKSRVNVGRGEGRLAARMRRGSILRYQRPHAAGVKHHPTEKPVPLLRELIESSSVMGETVVDPFAGSGSTLVAAQREGRRAVGIEVEEKYCEAAAQRLAQYREPIHV